VHVKIEFRLRKAIRDKTREFPEFRGDLNRFLKRGLSIADALKALVGETGARSGRSRGAAAQILSQSGLADVTKMLLQQLRRTKDRTQVSAIVSILARIPERRAFSALLKILSAANPDAAQAAAYCLRNLDSRAIPALISVVGDPSRPASVRAEAAESLGCFGDSRAIPALLFALQDKHPELRFWAVFALGQLGSTDDRIRRGLESMLTDPEIAPGWWSVGREAKALLTPVTLLQGEIREILSDSNASDEDRRWAECYCT
jgi:HEAT repeat protein